jgi:hypothetical protein
MRLYIDTSSHIQPFEPLRNPSPASVGMFNSFSLINLDTYSGAFLALQFNRKNEKNIIFFKKDDRK